MSTLIPEGSTRTVGGVDRHQIPVAYLTVIMGGHARVGFEDNVYFEKGALAESNGELVKKTVNVAKLLSRGVATSAETREILSLKPLFK